MVFRADLQKDTDGAGSDETEFNTDGRQQQRGVKGRLCDRRLRGHAGGDPHCHPYSSWERGTNEVTNKMIRRKIPKGTNFDDRTEEEVESIENWINGYPRKIHGYHSAGELFEEEVKQLA